MRPPSGARCCVIGAILASLSWGVIFFLYAHIDHFQPNAQSQSRIVPRRNYLIPIKNVEKEGVQYLDVEREQNRPGYAKFLGHGQHDAQLHDVEAVIDGPFADPVDAGMINTDEDQEQFSKGLKHHAFNSYLSSRLSFHRKIPDTREERCSSIEYSPKSLDKVSIVMCFYNEALSVLLRSLHSIWDRTDRSLLNEIILIDDNSEDVELKDTLDVYRAQTFDSRVRIVRNSNREGLIRSRMIGARVATSKVLVFLDSHVEVNVGWLEPLVSKLGEAGSTVVLPLIDIIDSDTFKYSRSPLVRGGFTWSMRFSWQDIPASTLESNLLYISSPTMAGGLLAIRKEYFFELGGYDEGMDIWGGENIEMSLRVWMCGGQIEIAVCSRVGHIFRKVRPYSSPTGEDTMTKNTLRMVNVWLDNDKERFHKATDNRYIDFPYGDVSERIALRNRLNCHDFGWYLKNVYNPDMVVNLQAAGNADQKLGKVKRKRQSSPLKILDKGKLKLFDSDLCILPSPYDDVVSNSPIVLTPCDATRVKWYEIEEGGFLISKNKCLDVVSSLATVTKCTGQGGTQHWILKATGNGYSMMYNPGTGRCLHVPKSEAGTRIDLETCDKASLFLYQKKKGGMSNDNRM